MTKEDAGRAHEPSRSPRSGASQERERERETIKLREQAFRRMAKGSGDEDALLLGRAKALREGGPFSQTRFGGAVA